MRKRLFNQAAFGRFLVQNFVEDLVSVLIGDFLNEQPLEIDQLKGTIRIFVVYGVYVEKDKI